MTKKRRAPIRLAVAKDEEDIKEGDDELGQRQAPNTDFLGRLVRGVATGNQRQLDATTSNAANLSIGATGAASLRLQLQRARSARFQTLRRVVLSSAEQQRLTLCTALLAEIAQGFGFRLTVRQPDGQEVGAAQAMAAVAHLREQHPDSHGAAVATGVDGYDRHREAAAPGEDGNVAAPGDADGGGGGRAGGEGGHPLDPRGALTPLHVELGLDSGDGGGAWGTQALAQEPLKSLVGNGLATRLARSPSGLRPARSARTSTLLTGRLMSAALGSMGLSGGGVVKKTAAAQAVQAAKRRVLLRAASNAAAEEDAVPSQGTAADLRGDSANTPPMSNRDAGAVVGANCDPAAATGSGNGVGRRIVWDPDNLSKPSAALVAPAGGRQGDGAGAPPVKRARTSLPSGAATAPLSGESGGGEAACAPTDSPSGSAADGLGGGGRSGATPQQAACVESGAAGSWEIKEDTETAGVNGMEHGTGPRAGSEPGDGQCMAAGGRPAKLDDSGAWQASHAGGRETGDEEPTCEDPAADNRAKQPRRLDGSAAAAKQQNVPRTARLLGAALAGSAGSSISASRSRAPIHTGAAAAATAFAAVAAAAASDDVNIEAATGACHADGVTGAAAGGSAAVSGGGSVQRAGGAGVRAAGRTVGAGGQGNAGPAGKLFGAAMRQLQRRSQG